MADSRSWQQMCKIILKYLLILESREALKSYVKRVQEPVLKRFLLARDGITEASKRIIPAVD